MRYQLLLFDLDETLYPATSGLWNAIAQRMEEYMVERLGISLAQVDIIRRTYFEKYGTTLKGLQANYQVDALDFLHYVHDIPLDQVLEPDPALRTLLHSLPQKKWICTNADRGHALTRQLFPWLVFRTQRAVCFLTTCLATWNPPR
ncbi:MAG: hypothetical protein MUE67_13470 [Anaerolineales bacterium]|nr:hypothetical protein [Anaerolineales bacterium]